MPCCFASVSYTHLDVYKRQMVSAAASGTMPLWAALLGLFAAVVMLNAACGILLGTPAAEPRRAVPARTSRPAVQLCVVRGGHAA